jgi:hypothetical protein
MRHDGNFDRSGRNWGRYRPQHAWLGRPGDGPAIRPRQYGRWRFRFRQLRVLLLAVLLAALAWYQLASHPAVPVAGEQAAR